jgi:hypothetical protein
MSDDITRIEYLPGEESRTPAQDGPAAERGLATDLINDVNEAIVGGAGAVIGAAAMKVIDKVGGKGGPPSGGQGQDPGPPSEAS